MTALAYFRFFQANATRMERAALHHANVTALSSQRRSALWSLLVANAGMIEAGVK